ncbi:MAG: DUF4124 domain-containing protein [Gallionella sp.]|nr:DUF4124 domain-containing protein [Gallionella sp.]MDH4285836.1 DUF4124 domain-containing protein [Gallionella sp.]
MNKYLLIFLMLASANAYPALIKWVDAEGQVHYSDVPPPPNTNTKILRTITKSADTQNENATTAASAPAPDAAKTIAERDAELKKAQQAKKEAAVKAAKAQADAEAKKAYCDGLQQNLRALQEGIRMVEVDASGNRSFVEDDQRQQRIAKTQKDISTNCK